MAINKSQHYVPKFYLKLFSNNREGKSIGLHNFKNNKTICFAPIKEQACEDYFYGKAINFNDK